VSCGIWLTRIGIWLDAPGEFDPSEAPFNTPGANGLGLRADHDRRLRGERRRGRGYSAAPAHRTKRSSATATARTRLSRATTGAGAPRREARLLPRFQASTAHRDSAEGWIRRVVPSAWAASSLTRRVRRAPSPEPMKRRAFRVTWASAPTGVPEWAGGRGNGAAWQD
jgi:hypothetical protein